MHRYDKCRTTVPGVVGVLFGSAKFALKRWQWRGSADADGGHSLSGWMIGAEDMARSFDNQENP